MVRGERRHAAPPIAQRLARAAQAAQELSDALWEALRDELADPRPERVAELSERLVAVAGTVSTLARGDRERAAEQPSPDTAQPDSPRAPARAGAAGARPAPVTVLVDELRAEAAASRPIRRMPGGAPSAAVEDVLEGVHQAASVARRRRWAVASAGLRAAGGDGLGRQRRCAERRRVGRAADHARADAHGVFDPELPGPPAP